MCCQFKCVQKSYWDPNENQPEQQHVKLGEEVLLHQLHRGLNIFHTQHINECSSLWRNHPHDVESLE